MNSDFRLAYWGTGTLVTRIPEARAGIWRYMDLGKLISMLVHQALFFPVVASLGDELEAARPKLPAGSTETERRQASFSWKQWRCICFANCWHCSEAESAAMWEIYAGRNQGIAVKSTFQSLASAFPAAAEDDKGQLIKVGLVEYIDPDLEQAMPSRLDGDIEVLRKRNWFSYEQELRLIFTIPNNMVDPWEDGAPFRTAGIWVPCDLRRLIEGVLIAPKAPPYLESAVREVLKLFEFQPELVKPSRLSEGSVRLTAN